MLTSKQRAKLRGMANSMDAIIQVGKAGVSDQLLEMVNHTLEVKELVKIRVLPNALFTAKEAAQAIAQATGADIVQVIGTKFVLFKPNEKEPKITID